EVLPGTRGRARDDAGLFRYDNPKPTCKIGVTVIMDLTAARRCFPGTRDCVFLDAACVSLLPTQAADALQQMTQALLTCPARDASAHHIALDQSADRPRREAARLIGAEPADIALIESTTQGLQALAATVPLGHGDTVLLGATEFMGLAVPWIPRQQAQGFRLEVVPQRDGRLLAEDFARRIDGGRRRGAISTSASRRRAGPSISRRRAFRQCATTTSTATLAPSRLAAPRIIPATRHWGRHWRSSMSWGSRISPDTCWI